MSKDYPSDRKPTIAAEFSRLADNARHKESVRLIEGQFSPLTESDIVAPAKPHAPGPSKSAAVSKKK